MKQIQEMVVTCLVIAALYTPFMWYMRELQSHRAGSTGFLELELLEQVVIVVLLIAPSWCLSCLKIAWRAEEPVA